MTKKQPGAKQTETDKRSNGARLDDPLTPGVQEAIGKQLRNVYGRMLAEPLPDRFKKLLDELKAAKPKEKP